jgi:hypothetical protein
MPSGQWINTNITGEVYALPAFNISGLPTLVAAPSSDQKINKVLGWNADGTIGWIAMVVSAIALVPGIEFVQEGYTREFLEMAIDCPGVFEASSASSDTATGIS